MEDVDPKLNDLNENLVIHFNKFKDEVNCLHPVTVKRLLQFVNMESDVLFYKVKNEMENFVRKFGNADEIKSLGSSQSNGSDVNTKKGEILMKLQAVSSMILVGTCNDPKIGCLNKL